MDENSLRDLLERAAAEQDPPVTAIVGSSLRVGRRLRRRRRTLAAAGGLACLGAVAAGGQALVSALGQGGQAATPTPPLASGGSRSAPAVPMPSWWGFVAPVVPGQHPAGHLVPVTAKAAELLLLDELPSGAHPVVKSQAATAHPAGQVSGQVDVTSAVGSGTVMASMSRPGGAKLSSCASADSGPEPGYLACRTFQLPGGVTVQEVLLGSTPSPAGGTDRYIVSVTVRRANGQSVRVQASSYRFGSPAEAGATTGLPLSVRQIVKAAADPRWARRMPASFVAQSASVQLPGVVPKG